MGGATRRRRLPADKSKAQTLHAKRRLQERYGLTLRCREIRELASRIKRADKQPEDTRPRFLVRQSYRLTVWMVPYEGKILILVYDSLRQTIVTALPPGSVVETPAVFKGETYVTT